MLPRAYCLSRFLSTPSARRATACGFGDRCSITYFYPRPPRGERLLCSNSLGSPSYFYPRPPRGERPATSAESILRTDFYPRPPRGERPHAFYVQNRPIGEFLSTPSARRATASTRFLKLCKVYFYPRPPRGERRHNGQMDGIWDIFLSTPSARRATVEAKVKAQQEKISIHALREESDNRTVRAKHGRRYFYPRPPRGERLGAHRHTPQQIQFLSTPSARRATLIQRAVGGASFVFLSTPSARRATYAPNFTIYGSIFLSTPSARRATTGGLNGHFLCKNFYPRPPRGERQQKQRENTLLLSHYTPLCTNCKEMSVNQTAKSHRYLRKRLVFRCEASRETMCAAGSHWPDIKRSARCLGQILGAVQCARPWSGSCCPAGRTADCPRQGRSGRSALL